MFRRVITGQIEPGRHGALVKAVEEAWRYQQEKGIKATMSVWDGITGKTNSFSIVSDFESLSELEKFHELGATDEKFIELRRRVMALIVFGSSETMILRRLL